MTAWTDLAARRGGVPVLEPGHVWLAGAGPGDPGLLTLDALAGLDQADVVVHDALVDPRVLALAGPRARLEFAGKRGGRPSPTQEDISQRLVALARAGERVLRLKGGDPLVFARGAEEAEALAVAGVPFRIIPGVTAGLAALAAARIPATRRGINRAVIFAAGYGADAGGAPDWAALARTSEPIVLYMAMRNLAEIADALVGGGLSADTPAAVIAAATTASQRVLVSTLGRVAADAAADGIEAPAIVVIGDIVKVRSELDAVAANEGAFAMTARGLIVAAPRSGSGKTTVTLALLAALRRRGVHVRAAKAGPDYIDAAFHAAATGAPSLNLDSWAMAPALLDALACEASQDAEALVIEGVMGLFDGVAAAPGRRGSTADLAAKFALPVMLVLDVSGQSQTAAAVAHGLATYDPAVRIAGVVLNRVGSARHQALVADAMMSVGMPVLGAVRRDPGLATPERHLGLVQAGEHADLAERLDRLADMAERDLDLDGIVAAAAPLKPFARGRGPVAARVPAAARAADRACRRSGVLVRLSSRRRVLAPRRRRDRRVLAARRRAAAGGLRQLLAAWRLSRASCRLRSRRRGGFATGWRGLPRPGRCTRSAAAIWCSAPASRMPTARGTRWRASSDTRRALRTASFISAIGRRGSLRRARSVRPASRCAATSSTTPA